MHYIFGQRKSGIHFPMSIGAKHMDRELNGSCIDVDWADDAIHDSSPQLRKRFMAVHKNLTRLDRHQYVLTKLFWGGDEND